MLERAAASGIGEPSSKSGPATWPRSACIGDDGHFCQNARIYLSQIRNAAT